MLDSLTHSLLFPTITMIKEDWPQESLCWRSSTLEWSRFGGCRLLRKQQQFQWLLLATTINPCRNGVGVGCFHHQHQLTHELLLEKQKKTPTSLGLLARASSADKKLHLLRYIQFTVPSSRPETYYASVVYCLL